MENTTFKTYQTNNNYHIKYLLGVVHARYEFQFEGFNTGHGVVAVNADSLERTLLAQFADLHDAIDFADWLRAGQTEIVGREQVADRHYISVAERRAKLTAQIGAYNAIADIADQIKRVLKDGKGRVTNDAIKQIISDLNLPDRFEGLHVYGNVSDGTLTIQAHKTVSLNRQSSYFHASERAVISSNLNSYKREDFVIAAGEISSEAAQNIHRLEGEFGKWFVGRDNLEEIVLEAEQLKLRLQELSKYLPHL